MLTKHNLQKQALLIGLPKSLTKLSTLFGYSSSYLTDVFSKNKTLDKRVSVIFELHKKIYELEQKLNGEPFDLNEIEITDKR